MTGPYGDKRLCESFSPQELDETFHYPGDPRRPPLPLTRSAWDEAKEVCIECPAFLRCRAQCWGEMDGVLGGTDPRERYLYRRQLTRALVRQAPGERAELARSLWTMHAPYRGVTTTEIARRTGYAHHTVTELIAEHEAVLRQRREARRPPKEASPAVSRIRREPVWPQADPEFGNVWVWYGECAYQGACVARTDDGSAFKIRFRGPKQTPATKWFPAHEVRFPSGVPDGIEIRNRSGASAA